MRTKLLLATAVVTTAVSVGACGGGDTAKKTAAASACRPAVATSLHTIANATVASLPTPPQPGLTGCTYRLGDDTSVNVIVDRNPQGLKRFGRAVVETDQNSIWFNQPAKAPRLINGVGLGADWVPGDGRLLVTDGVALVTIVVKPPAATAQALAVATARGTLRRGSG